jgi:beta-ketodecanoyl-[acyl-carrier-protein] synthase
LKTIISGTGLFVPEDVITNEELVKAYNAYVERQNEQNASQIASGECEALKCSSVEFVEKASGIKRRHVIDKRGVLDPGRMKPHLPQRDNDQPSLQCEMGVKAAKKALAMANRSVGDVDLLIVACSNLERAYPAVSVEIQAALGIDGYAFDMNIACSSATFGIQTAKDAIAAGSAKTVMMINPEICSAHLNFCDRDSHFIFGDVCTAMVLEAEDTQKPKSGFEIIGTRLRTKFSNNIRNNFGFLNHCDEDRAGDVDKLFVQEGRKVFKEVIPMVSAHILAHLESLEISPQSVKRMWLHQANLSMNQLVAKRVWDRAFDESEAPIVLDDFANTSSAGSIIAFHQRQEDLSPGDLGVICSFGAGYSVGTVLVRKL